MKRILTIDGRETLKRFLKIWWNRPLTYSTMNDRVAVLSFVAGMILGVLITVNLLS